MIFTSRGAVGRSESVVPGVSARTRPNGLVLLLLFPLFFARVFIGGHVAISYEELRGVSLVPIGYVCHFAIWANHLISQSSSPTSDMLRRVLLPATSLSIVHVAILAMAQPIGYEEAIFAIFRSLLWFGACLIVASSVTIEEFLDGLLFLTRITFFAVIAFAIVYWLTGIPFQIIFRGSAIRSQAFMSEPFHGGVYSRRYMGSAYTKESGDPSFWQQLSCFA